MSPTSPKSHGAPELPYCRNCHFTLATPRPVYCGHCGQETDLHPPSVREMFTEYLGHYVAFDGPLWRTLWALVCLPGHLTNAYFRGQRRRYVLPLRVYLTASFLFFVGYHLLQHGKHEEQEADVESSQPAAPGKPVKVKVKPGQTPAEAEAEAASTAGQGKKSVNTKLGCDEQHPEACSRSELLVTGLVTKGKSMTGDQWKARFSALAPYGMLAMQPVFAALLLAMFAGSGRRYAEHFVFSLHSHSLWFLALLLAMAANIEGLMTFAVFGQGLVAMRNVYRLSWFGAIWRGLLLSMGYFVLLVVGVGLLVAGIAATA
ncbi:MULTISPECIES: DUF3667 domain-containing protein [unclassified Roseateles]|uniref:DUF3667 domain-containing protein n=1 Tax=Pelomonas sp. Root1237 TaxID=1736434 RepID=UPI0006F4CDC8|nr:DUF3667 domain-containing protein [Pelomonas sp. Root1237]KQV95096.1 hypothetical protein ASC91_26100 [Pelomonas sp. Root1237]